MKSKGDRKIGLFFILFLLLLGISLVSASPAITTRYSDNNPLRLSPGESAETFFIVQNVPQEGEGNLEIEVFPGESEIATFTDENLKFDISVGQSVDIPVEIDIPTDAEVGTQYSVGALFKPISRDEGGNVQLVLNIGKSFPVIVKGEIEEVVEEAIPETARGVYLVSIIIGFLIVMIVIVFVLIMYFARRNRQVQEVG